MTPERWRLAQEIFLAATEREAGTTRDAFLDEACGGDPEVRREVESLLFSLKAVPQDFLESPAIEGLPVLPPAGQAGARAIGKGTRLGPYEVLSPIGAGGMGEVYRARDGRLGREVAIKVLSAELSQETSRVKRFEKEARSASALNHPNIVTVYDVGTSDGLSYIAMEKIDGETLRKLITGGPVAIKKVLAIVTQVAEGLARAHEAGIVHRDLKPENVMVTKDGLAKILDFGLAKLSSTGSGSDESSKLPTVSGTTPGVIMGTVGYMSPEQASGATVDFRSDQFSFGSIVYEMVTGKRAFQGKTPIDVLGAVLNAEPQPVATINPQVPTHLRWIVERCLSKEPRQRYSSTDDLARDLATLRDHLSEATSGAAAGVRSSGTFLRRALLGIAALLLVAGAVFQLTRGPKLPLREMTLRQVTSNSVENPVTASSISPDGKLLLFKDRKGIHVQLIETSEAQTVAEPEATRSRGLIWDLGPWFPSSTRFLINAHVPDVDNPISRGSSIWVASVLGGPAQKLREDGIAWAISPAGSEIAFGTNQGPFGDREIWLMDPAGERPRKLFDADADSGVLALGWFDEGRQVAYVRHGKDGDSSMRRDLKGGLATTIFPPSEWKQYNDLTWLPDGRLIYTVPEPNTLNECNYWVRRLDLRTGRPVGGTKKLTNFSGSCMFSSNATADGKRVAFVKQMLHFTGYVADLAAAGTKLENPRHFTLTSSEDFPGDWMPDSSAVIVLSNRTGQFGLYRQRLDQETAELIAAAKDGFGNPRVSPDGQWIVFWRDAEASGAEESQRDIMRIPITGGAAHLIFKARPLCWILVSKPPSRMCAIAELIEKKLVISAFDPLKGRGRELTHFDIDPNRDWRDWSMDLSPDGARIAAVLRPEDPISILSLDGQPTQEIRPKGLRQVLSVSWTADGKGLFVFNGQSGKSELFHVDLQGNAQALWKSNGDSGGSGPLPSPDGRHIALLDSATESNAWLMENP